MECLLSTNWSFKTKIVTNIFIIYPEYYKLILTMESSSICILVEGVHAMQQNIYSV